ncbi:MAG: hypothetical protein J6I69_02790 [Bacilli bacterium]|nr:hypothetical protein [Bacilli bacterium]
MAKSVISQSDELSRYRTHLKRVSFWSDFGLFLGILLTWFLYVLLVAFGRGYYSLPKPFGEVSPLRVLPYPDWSGNFFDFSSIDKALRMIIVLAVLIVAIVGTLLLHHFQNKKFKKLFENKSFSLLVEEAKINGIGLDKSIQEGSVQGLDLVDISTPTFLDSYQFSTPLLSYQCKQYDYFREGKKRKGVFISVEVPKGKSHAFIQLRTFGNISYRQYEGNEIKKYGFGDIRELSAFVCYSTLGRDIYLVFNKKTAEAISSMHQFVRSDVIITSIGEKLTIFIDGFSFDFVSDYSKKVPPTILETKAETLVAFHSAIARVVNAFTDDKTLPFEEDSGNGILSY